MVRRVARGWVIENSNGRVIGGPYFSQSYAEERARELYAEQRKQTRTERIKMKRGG